MSLQGFQRAGNSRRMPLWKIYKRLWIYLKNYGYSSFCSAFVQVRKTMIIESEVKKDV